MTIKYIVLKQNTRSYTLAAIYPDTKQSKRDATNHARSLSAREKCNTLVCSVVEDVVYKEDLVTRK